MKNIYAEKALNKIPHILVLVDRNKFSKTYGCFDRDYWHYKKIDFPSAYPQVGVLPLSLVYRYKFPNNVYFRKERIKEILIAGIKFLEKCSHNDCSVDDFYPYERALGATSLSLYACSESYLILNCKDEDIMGFFMKQADWLIRNDEPGMIANHQAISATSLLNVYLLTGKNKYLRGAQKRIEKVLSWESDEGWFQEYMGCDPGYLTYTIDFLAKYYQKTDDKNLLEPIKRAITFSSYFMHPDGSYAGEYGSRGTRHFYPAGFEIMGKEYSLASQIADKHLEGIQNNKNISVEDDRGISVYVSDYLQAYLNFSERRNGSLEFKRDFEKYFNGSKFYITKKNNYYCVFSFAKGGVFKIFEGNKHVYTDCGLIGVLNNDKLITTQMVDDYSIEIGGRKIVRGQFNVINNILPTPFKFILFRMGLLLLARDYRLGKIIKRILTKKLITDNKRVPIFFERVIESNTEHIKIIDKIENKSNFKFKKLAIATNLNAIYVPGSRYYQESDLDEWVDLSSYIPELNEKKDVTITRTIK